MEIVSEGSLESISRPSSTASEQGRRSSRKVHNVQQLQHSSSLEILPPEEISGIPSELFSALERDVEVEEYEEVESDSNCDSEYSLNEDLVEDCCDDSDNEIAASVSEKQDSPYTSRTDNIHPQEELSALTDGGDVNPQIREGMEKIKKLDKILADKIKKEKEVKNHRHQMEKMWKEQLLKIVKVQDDGSHGNQTLIGATLLALELGNEDVLGSSREDLVTPVFATQPLGAEENYTHYKSSKASGSTTRGSSRSSTRDDKTKKDKKSGRKHRDKRSKSAQSDSSKKTHKSKDKHLDLGQDFIQRNKKLAADAGNFIPMTDDEKKRLEELLSSDINEMMENPYDDDSLRLTDGFGFRPDQESSRALADIDEKLKALVPASELEMLSSRALTDTPLSQRSEAPSDTSSQGSTKRVLETIDDVDIGERVLREGKEARDLNQRIMDIEMELKKLKEISDDDIEDTISRALLDKLISESSRTTSRSTTIAESVVSSLATPHYFAIEQGGQDIQTPMEESDNSVTPSTPGTVSALSDFTLTPRGERNNSTTPRTLGRISASSDVTFTSTDIDTPRTLTSASSFGMDL